MRILLDTNVLIAAFIARGVCHALFEYCIQKHTLISSEFILSELREKLTDKFKYSKQDADDVVRHIQTRIEIVFPDDPVESVCRDPDDDHILAAAVTGNCDYVITGDKDLLLLHSYNNIRIFSPAEFQKFEDSLKPE